MSGGKVSHLQQSPCRPAADRGGRRMCGLLRVILRTCIQKYGIVTLKRVFLKSCDAGLLAGGAKVLNVAKSGRRGVASGYTKDPAKAASMPVRTIVNIVLYELKHAYFKVGCSHVLQQIIGVSMGSQRWTCSSLVCVHGE